tara:strand:+ start:117 stop:770 length:654 start_codon:yes stop_codon:yes gene_type:complete
MIPFKAKLQWAKVLSVYVWFVLLGLFIVPFVILFSKPMTNFVGERKQRHRDKYLDQGSSGEWEYLGTDIPVLKWWSNLEDGNLGEPSGKQSMRWKGKERSFVAQYTWLALRNPVNYLKRTWSFLHCPINDCTIEYVGDFYINDKYPDSVGEQFVTATHKVTGDKYYGYYSVEDLGNYQCKVERYGFKIRPSHADSIQDADDLDKAFTMRYQPKSRFG